MRKLVVLDFDGCIHTHSIHRRQVPNQLCVANLNRLLSVTHADVLVSSAWRGETIRPMRELLQSWGIWGRVVGVTPRLVEYVEQDPFVIWQTREKEIETWLHTHRPYDRLVVLDDEGDGFINLKPYLVQCSIDAGLTARLTIEAISLLEGLSSRFLRTTHQVTW